MHNVATAVYAAYVFVFFLKQVTYVLEGVTAHEDFCGHSGRLKPGDLQVLHNCLYSSHLGFLKCQTIPLTSPQTKWIGYIFSDIQIHMLSNRGIIVIYDSSPLIVNVVYCKQVINLNQKHSVHKLQEQKT